MKGDVNVAGRGIRTRNYGKQASQARSARLRGICTAEYGLGFDALTEAAAFNSAACRRAGWWSLLDAGALVELASAGARAAACRSQS